MPEAACHNGARGLRRVLSSDQVTTVARHLDRRFGVDALWLFGSEASDSARVSSDVDLAGLFRNHPSALDLLEAREELGVLLARPVDLVDLDRASPILAMQVFRYGRLLVDANPSRRIRAMASAPVRYEDLRILRRQAERILMERIRGGRS
jgi:predicted nucleotidyltransferase